MEVLSIKPLEFPPFDEQVEFSKNYILFTLYITSYKDYYEAGYYLNQGDGLKSPGGLVKKNFPVSEEGYADACKYISSLRMEIIKKLV